jgi:hypothetical protein
MTTAQAMQRQNVSSTPYERLMRKGMSVACFLFPALYLLSALLFALDRGEFVEAPVSSWAGGNDVQLYFVASLAWFAGIPAMVGVARLLKDEMPRLAFWSVVFVFIGGLNQFSEEKVALQHALLRELGLEVYWNTVEISQFPPMVVGITVVLWMLGLTMLGLGIWRSGVLPRWVGGILALGALSFFLYQGPGGIVREIPPLAYVAAGICFLLAFPVVGLRLWQPEAGAAPAYGSEAVTT